MSTVNDWTNNVWGILSVSIYRVVTIRGGIGQHPIRCMHERCALVISFSPFDWIEAGGQKTKTGQVDKGTLSKCIVLELS